MNKTFAASKRFSIAAISVAGSLSLGGCDLSNDYILASYLEISPAREGMNYTCTSKAFTPVNYTNQWGYKYRDLGLVVNETTLDASQKKLAEEMTKRFPKSPYRETCESVNMVRTPSGGLQGAVTPVSTREVFPQP